MRRIVVWLMLLLTLATAADAKKKKYNNGDVYKGQWQHDFPHGEGVMTYANGDIYSGHWQNGKREGFGRMTYKDGSSYEGNWNAGIYSGEGRMTYQNGEVYQGAWLQGLPNGEGKKTFVNGDVFSGHWTDGIYDEGVLLYASGARMEGIFEQNGHFKGTFESKDHDIFNGEWPSQDVGEGEVKYRDGNIYAGTWARFLPEGNGEMKLTDGSVKKGQWKNGKLFNGTHLFQREGLSYELSYQNGSENGAEITYSDDARYEGQLENFAPSGKGTFCCTLTDSIGNRNDITISGTFLRGLPDESQALLPQSTTSQQPSPRLTLAISTEGNHVAFLYHGEHLFTVMANDLHELQTALQQWYLVNSSSLYEHIARIDSLIQQEKETTSEEHQ